MARTKQELEAMRDMVVALTASQQLVLAAGLIDQGELKLARTIIEGVSGAIALKLLTDKARG